MTRIIVETTYSEPVEVPILDDRFGQLMSCLHRRQVRWVRSFVSGDRLRVISELDATDAETVRQSYRIAGIPFERIWSAQIVTENQVRQ